MPSPQPDKAPLPILRPQTKWEDLYFYRKADVLYQLTVVFCRRFLPKFGDRTVAGGPLDCLSSVPLVESAA